MSLASAFRRRCRSSDWGSPPHTLPLPAVSLAGAWPLPTTSLRHARLATRLSAFSWLSKTKASRELSDCCWSNIHSWICWTGYHMIFYQKNRDSNEYPRIHVGPTVPLRVVHMSSLENMMEATTWGQESILLWKCRARRRNSCAEMSLTLENEVPPY
jgi:hypothetical protein